MLSYHDQEVIMQNSTLLLMTAVIPAGLILLVPQIVQLRVKVLRFLKLNWLADLHENNFRIMVIAMRVILAVLAGLLVYLGLTD